MLPLRHEGDAVAEAMRREVYVVQWHPGSEPDPLSSDGHDG
jgi:hypothetical protein